MLQRSLSRKLLQAHILLCSLLISGYAAAKVRTITATGEYRMGDNDTRTDAKRLALLDAKRLALEQAGTYLESVSEVKNLQVSRDEIRAYTAGIVEVTEQTTKDVMESATHIVRVEVTAQVDTAAIARQITTLQNNEFVRNELLRTKDELDLLRQTLASKTRELASLKSNDERRVAERHRQDVLAKTEATALLLRADVLLAGTQETFSIVGTSTIEGRLGARALVEKALVLDPSLSAGHYLMGRVLLEEGNYRLAVKEFQIAINSQPETSEYHNGLALALTELGDTDHAIESLMIALRLRPGYANAHYNLGNILVQTGNLHGAVVEYAEATRIAPNRAAYHSNLGRVYAMMGDTIHAVAAYRAALRMQPNLVEALSGLSVILADSGEVAEAIATSREAIRLRPAYPLAHHNLGRALLYKQDVDGAVAEFREALRLQPELAEAHMGLAAAFAKAGNITEAIAETRTALLLKPDDADAHFNLGMLLVDKGLKRDAEQEFRTYLRVVPNRPDRRNSIEKARAMLRALEQ